MARRVKLEVEGLNEALESIGALFGTSIDATRAVVAEVTREIHTDARQAIDRLSGKTRSSVRMRLPADTGRAVGIVGSNYFVARFLEHGTSKMRPHPWLLPAFERGVTGVASALKAEFERRT